MVRRSEIMVDNILVLRSWYQHATILLDFIMTWRHVYHIIKHDCWAVSQGVSTHKRVQQIKIPTNKYMYWNQPAGGHKIDLLRPSKHSDSRDYPTEPSSIPFAALESTAQVKRKGYPTPLSRRGSSLMVICRMSWLYRKMCRILSAPASSRPSNTIPCWRNSTEKSGGRAGKVKKWPFTSNALQPLVWSHEL